MSEIARPRFAEGFDAVILGHFHYPLHHAEGGRDLVVLGDWIRHFTFAKLQNGELALWRWDVEEGRPLPLARAAAQAHALVR